MKIGNGYWLQGECLETMNRMKDNSFDMILCDLPYGTTACKWDTVIPFKPLWEQYHRIAKERAAIVLTASQPFTSALVMSNFDCFRYSWVWEKPQGVNFQLSKIQPMKNHEDICVFGKKSPKYFPQGLIEINKHKKAKTSNIGHLGNESKIDHIQTHSNYPKSVQKFPIKRGFHPTQKPVALFEYLIKTYTNEGDTVLDNCAGSGTTAIACENTGRKWVCIEREPDYSVKAIERIKEHIK